MFPYFWMWIFILLLSVFILFFMKLFFSNLISKQNKNNSLNNYSHYVKLDKTVKFKF
uniref:ATP synthase F0 subunit 8 n=1 Tax=Heterodoxus spiniger TaxID=762516 RepID=A0A7T1M849_9NEOP|nr:ATP synthase F0 subunit 8 [Heterodoxus spiniger]